ncbi:hypothetical protein KMZ32_16320 [Phycicoccus sp. MAQZ13P-2]|nr:hypothetical protein [Phycicoccus mangrovi]MBT9257481.1 hypothetical protein [Phycicoccus mangrovi]MBT9275645.1 hypothetical protein [Phycicoccus mangrovi]
MPTQQGSPTSTALAPTPSLTPSPSPSPSSSSPSPSDEPDLDIAVRDGFLAVRYTCTYVEDSFQADWIDEARRAKDFGKPDRTERYTNDAAGGRADLIFGKAFNAGVGSKDPVRVRSRLDGPGRLTIWVTKPHPAKGLDLQAAGRGTLNDLGTMMSSRRSASEGSCSLRSADPLPPVYVGTPDDR